MIDLSNLLRILTKESVQVSVEEFVFLNIVRINTVEDSYDKNSDLLKYIDAYFTSNNFYGKGLYPEGEEKVVGWNLMIDKLVKQGYLLDYRKDKKLFYIKELIVTEKFSKEIWEDDKDKIWDEFHTVVLSKVGGSFDVDGNSIQYFSISNADKVNGMKNYAGMVNYFWNNICKNGDMFYIGRFFSHMEFFLEK